MYVVATAGHVDHGKSTLLRRLTGMEPDRLAQEQARGLTIELGHVWQPLGSGQAVAYVDVPGHERFLNTMLAGVGPVPAVLFVVAADGGWMPQSQEHLMTLDALGVAHGVLAVTRCDLAEPGPALAQARRQLAGTTLADIPAVAVSAHTGAGLADLTAAIERMVGGLPRPRTDGAVRLWLDRSFTIRGMGAVVTGTLGAGTLRVGDELAVAPTGQRVRVRGLQALHQTVDRVAAVARVAVNVRGVDTREVSRGMALLTPDRWDMVATVDVRLDRTGPAGSVGPAEEARLPPELSLHIGSARSVAAVRSLARDGSCQIVRLTLREPLPLHVGDRAVLRDPGGAAGGTRIVGRVTVLDVRPQPAQRRGDTAARGRELLALADVPDGAAMVRHRGVLHRAELARMGLHAPADLLAGDWYLDPDHRKRIGVRLGELVSAYAAANPLQPGMPVDIARQELLLPDRRLVELLIRPPLRLADGRIHDVRRAPALPAPLARAVDQLTAQLAAAPFQAPDHDSLLRLGLDRRGLAAAAKAGALLRVAEGVVLLPGADDAAARVLADLPQPFTVAAARAALNTTRRVVIPLLEHLDRRGVTEWVDDGQRRLR